MCTLTPAISIMNIAAPKTCPALYAVNLIPLTSTSYKNKIIREEYSLLFY